MDSNMDSNMDNTENTMGGVGGAPQKSNGALVGSIIIVIILVLGGIYLLRNSINRNTLPTNDLAGADAESLQEVESDLNSMDLEGLDSDI